jgi:hypothetical protein
MERRDHNATPHRIEQGEGRALATANILKGLKLDEAHATEVPRSGRLKGLEANCRLLGGCAVLGYALKYLCKSLLCRQYATP